MPVPYVSQFIPTNTQALQGVLSDYQRAYDEQVNRELSTIDQYSAIPTVTAADTERKNNILNQFSNVISKDLEPKYNYDKASAAYAKDLARKISQLRSDPFWSYNTQKQDLIKMDQEMRARLGANYYSAYNPINATYEDQSAIRNYKPMSLEDLYKYVGAKALEKSTEFNSQIARNVYLPGTQTPFAMEIGTQFGFKDENTARRWLDNNPGWLSEALQGSGFEQYANDPTVLMHAYNAAMSNLIGKEDTQKIALPNDRSRNWPTYFSNPAITKDGQQVAKNPTSIANDILKGHRLPIQPILPDVEKTMRVKNTKDFLVNAFVPQIRVGQLAVKVFNDIFPGRKATDERSGYDQYADYMLSNTISQAASSNDEATKNIYNSGMSVINDAIKAYGLKENDAAELYKLSLLHAWSGRDKHAIQKAVEDITGKHAEYISDIGRSYNSWYNGGGDRLKQMFSDNVNKLDKTWKANSFDYTVKSTEKNEFADWASSVMPFAKPMLTGNKEKDGSTKSTMHNSHMDYFDDSKLKSFLSEQGDYKFNWYTSNDDMPYFSITNAKGKTINFELPFYPNKPESLQAWRQLAMNLNDPSLVIDAFSSKFNILPGEVISKPNDDIKEAAYLVGSLNNRDANEIDANIESFFNKYEIRKALDGNNSFYQIREKGTDNWSTGHPSKAQLIDIMSSPNK